MMKQQALLIVSPDDGEIGVNVVTAALERYVGRYYRVFDARYIDDSVTTEELEAGFIVVELDE